MSDAKVVSLDGIKVACSNCGLSTLCLPFGLNPDDVERLENIVRRNRPLQRGQMLYSPGDRFRSLYVVKTGAVKTYTQTPSGDEHVIGFHLPGEILGLDAIQEDQHGCFAKALETTAVCEMPFLRLEELAINIPSLQHQMLRLLSREVSAEAQMISLLNNSTAEERLASFLLSLSDRFRRRGFSACDFFLAMSRQDIGSYLGLALETVSRLFTRFQDQGLLKVDRKHVQIEDIDGLRALLKHRNQCGNSANGSS
jgi:CRP/FNR family transcriptional regulator, anaerobic regulatory protein